MFKRKLMNARVLAACLAASMTFGTCSGVSFAATGSEVAKDGTYTGSAHVTRVEEEDEEDEWNEYDVDVSLTVADGAFSDITVTPKNGYESENKSYFTQAYTGKKGIKTKLEGQAATEDTINGWDVTSGATRTKNAVKEAALEAIRQAEAKGDVPETVDTTALETAIADAKALTETDYTAESWSALQEALTAAEAALEAKESQDAVTAAATALQDAVKKLEKAPEVTVDTAALEAAIAKAEALQEADYTEESWSAAKDEIEAALTEAKAALDAKESQEAVTAAADKLTAAMEKLEEKVEDEYTYVYAALSYAEYYAAEDVQAAGSTAAGAGNDTRNEADLGAFDAVTRATTIHGLHRSNFQQDSVIYDTDGNAYEVTSWDAAGKNLNLVDGTSIGFSKGAITKADGSTATMDYYEIKGIKYVPVAVKTADYEAFKAQYQVIENGGTLAGGYGEDQLKAYTAIAEVDKDTNGLKVAEKNGDTFSFGARQTGTGSGIQGQAQKTAEQANLGVAVQETSAYGDFIRVDLKSNYGDLGGAMQTVVWKYYGDGDTAGTPLATYGTKFAADNWMHKSNGIQLGLTNSLRCTLPEGSDGSGKWTLTIYALGYADTTIEVDVAKDDIHMATPISDTSKLEEAVAAAEALTEADYTADSWSKMQTELKEAQDALKDAANGKGSQETIDECVSHLNEAVEALEKAEIAYTYVYAALSYAEYYAAEDVQAAGSAAAGAGKDTRNEADLGAFDAVTRATTIHGLHRSNFQQDSVMYDTDGNSYKVGIWEADGKNLNLVDSNGASCSFSGGTITKADGSITTMDHYEIEGIKYVPVAVKTADYEAFKAQYQVIENGGTLAGGFSENKLNAYTAIAEVDKDTNGLKVAEKNGDAFTFGARQTGTGSGIQGQEQKSAEQANLGVAVQETSSYGDFIRVDLKSNYGDLGGAMQTVVWKYYGDGDTTGTPLATYGTKFAADNWMHKSNGIQLGLTNSLRCTLPEGSDGSGKWTLTIYALGYADTTIEVDIAKDDIHMATPISDTSKLEEAVAAAEALTEIDYTADSWSKMQTELKEAKDALADAAKGTGSQETIDECVEHLNASVKDLQLLYVWMNIPYDAFYAAEVNNDVKVDAFTSATLNKTRTGSLVGGSYHVDSNGTDITGITYPVKVTEEQLAALKADADKYKQITEDSSVTIKVTNRGQTSETTYTGKDALFEAPSYAYFADETEVPAYYKELTVDADGTFSFGKVQAAEQKLEDASATLTTESSYGDYQMEVSGLPEEVNTVYAVVLNTKEGNGYGLRHMENIWRKTELAWCTGFTKAVHNCPTSSDHYKAMMGQTISQIVYYTDQGVYTIDTDLKVPTTLSAEVSAESGKAGTGVVKFALSEQLPADFVAKYSVAGLNIQVNNGEISFTNGMPGKYVLTITDESGTYAPLSGEFLLTTDEMPAKWDADKKSLAAATEGEQGEADFANYVKQISSVVVNGKEYAASGRGSVVIINKDGSLNTAASVFADGKEFTIEVKATGYEKSLSFTYTAATTPDNGNNSGDNGNNSGDNGNNSGDNGNNSGNNSSNNGSNNGSSNNGTTNGGNTSNGSNTNNGSSNNDSSSNGSSNNGSSDNGSSSSGSHSSGSSTSEDTTTATPKTGDNTNIMLWAVMAVVAVILGVFGIRLQKVGRRTHKKKH